MSRVYFATRAKGAELKGWERAWCGGIVDDIAMGMVDFGPARHINDTVYELISPGHYAKKRPDPAAHYLDHLNWLNTVKTAWNVDLGGTPLLTWKGEKLSPWQISLNTVMAVGSDPVKLMARLHAQCEIHAWVDEANREWLAKIIEAGRRSGVMRPEAGWEEVVELLRDDDAPGEVVTWYSVTESFPNPYVAEWQPGDLIGNALDDAIASGEVEEPDADEEEDAWEKWSELPADKQWELAMAKLRERKDYGLELKPDGWDDYYFGRSITVMDLHAKDWRERLDRAIGVE